MATPARKTDTDTAPRVVPEIESKDVRIQSEGQQWREWLVILPEGAVLDDLGNHASELFRKVQGSPQVALRQLDRLRVLAHDRRWEAWCSVVYSDTSTVKLSRPAKVDLAAADEHWQDDDVQTKFVGDGYTIIRRKDDVRMLPGSFASAEAAKAAWFASKPRQVT